MSLKSRHGLQYLQQTDITRLTGFLLRGLPCFLLGLIAIRCLAALWLRGTLVVDGSPSAERTIIITTTLIIMTNYYEWHFVKDLIFKSAK